MDILSQMIQHMDRHAVKHFKVFASRAHDEDQRKDFNLFDFIRKNGPEYDEEKIFRKIYQTEDKNAFYRLKNRLTQDLSLSIFLQKHEQNDHMLCMYYVAMGYHYSGINSYKVAWHFFKKAEQKSRDIEHYGLLDIIYSQMIKLAREIVSINPETYIQKRKENRTILNRLSEVEDILEALEYRMKITQNISAENVSVTSLLNDTLNEYTRDEELKASPKVQFGIYFIISRVLLQKKDYAALQDYLVTTLSLFKERNLFNKTNQQHKLQMLAWIANAAFANKQYSISLEYAEELYREMQRFDRVHFDSFEFFYYNIQILNFSVINRKKALEILQSLTRKEFIEKQDYYGTFIYFNLALIYYLEREYSKAIHNLNKLYQHTGYDKLDAKVRLRANIGELLMRFELKDMDLLDYRLKQVIRETKELAEVSDYAPEISFIQLFSRLASDPALARKESFRTDVTSYLESYKEMLESEDTLFKYDEWLEKKTGI